MASPKIKRAKIVRIIKDSVVRGRLSENYLFIARNICNAKYSRITVIIQTRLWLWIFVAKNKEHTVQQEYLEEKYKLILVSWQSVFATAKLKAAKISYLHMAIPAR